MPSATLSPRGRLPCVRELTRRIGARAGERRGSRRRLGGRQQRLRAAVGAVSSSLDLASAARLRLGGDEGDEGHEARDGGGLEQRGDEECVTVVDLRSGGAVARGWRRCDANAGQCVSGKGAA
eukprot:3006190-Prymnesium_polylepis.1